VWLYKELTSLRDSRAKQKGRTRHRRGPFAFSQKRGGNVFEKQSDKLESYSSRLFFAINAFNACTLQALLTMLISIYKSLKTFITKTCQKYFISLLEEIVDKSLTASARGVFW